MSGPRILVFGGGGFLGSSFCDLLKFEGVEFLKFERTKDFSFLSFPGYSRESLKLAIQSFGPDIVINLANHFSRGFDLAQLTQTIEANVILPVEIGQICAKAGVRFIHLGSYWQLEYFAENPKFRSLYLESKIVASKSLDQIFEGHGLFLELLVPDTFGLNDHRDKLIPLLTKKLKKGECIELNDPLAILNLCSSDGVSRVLLDIARKAKFSSKKLLLAPSLQISVRELIRQVGAVECGNPVQGDSLLQAPDFRLISDGVTTIFPREHDPLGRLKNAIRGSSPLS